MLYLDSSALIKRYIQEVGTEALNKKWEAEQQLQSRIFTSVITFAEVHGMFARRRREHLLSTVEFRRLRDAFVSDWAFDLSHVELDAGVLGFISGLVESFRLKGQDAIQLASALWLRDALRLGKHFGSGSRVVTFASSDERLNIAAAQLGLEVFDPEKKP